MYSFSIDYLFNRVYDILLFIKYTWLFVMLRDDPQEYLDKHVHSDWDGLRDRGWFDSYLANKDLAVPEAEVHKSLWQKILESTGHKLPDSDGDGIPDVTDPSPHDVYNVSKAELKERYEQDYNFYDHVRDVFGVGPRDSDTDGIPDSYELKHNLDQNNYDGDRDGLSDGQELLMDTNPLNNDTDHDAVIDGRDEAPLDANITSIGPDSDGDGVSDKIEKLLNMDIHSRDSDSDGIPDGMDTYPLDPNNIGQYSQVDLGKAVEGIHFSIQNPVFALFADFLSVVSILAITAFVYSFMRWLLTFLNSLDHYDHHFATSHGTRNSLHTIKHTEAKANHSVVPNLPVFEESHVTPPTVQEFKNHPKFAVIQGYMSSGSEALWRIGILEADNLLLEVLRVKGYTGDSVSEMLKQASFKTIDLAWDAHKIRNRIAHDGSEFELTEREAKRAFVLYESVFREMKIVA